MLCYVFVCHKSTSMSYLDIENTFFLVQHIEAIYCISIQIYIGIFRCHSFKSFLVLSKIYYSSNPLPPSPLLFLPSSTLQPLYFMLCLKIFFSSIFQPRCTAGALRCLLWNKLVSIQAFSCIQASKAGKHHPKKTFFLYKLELWLISEDEVLLQLCKVQL